MYDSECKEDDGVFAQCQRLGIPYFPLSEATLSEEIMSLLPLEIARQYQAIPLAEEDGCLTVAMAKPDDQAYIAALEAATGYRIFPVYSSPLDISAALEQLRQKI